MPVTAQWISGAPKVAQIQTITIGTNDAGTTYAAIIGGVTVSVTGQGSANATASALQVALTASTHGYFNMLAFSVVTNVITCTTKSGNHGAPFTLTVLATGGTGGLTTAVTQTATGPNHYSNIANWSTNLVPVAGDTVVVSDNSNPILWDIDQNAVTLAVLRVLQTFTGVIGLNRNVFTQSSDGLTYDGTINEYRTGIYLKISATKSFIGENFSPAKPNGSGRILIDFGTVTGQSLEVFNTAATPTETGKPAVRIKVVHNTFVLSVRSAPGGVGVAMDAPGEVSTVASITNSGTSADKVFTGLGTTITTFNQYGGNNVLQAAATIGTVNVYGGILETEGDFTITAFNMAAGTYYGSHFKTAGNFITTLNALGGQIDLTDSPRARTINSLVLSRGVTFKYDPNVITLTAVTFPTAAGPIKLALT